MSQSKPVVPQNDNVAHALAGAGGGILSMALTMQRRMFRNESVHYVSTPGVGFTLHSKIASDGLAYMLQAIRWTTATIRRFDFICHVYIDCCSDQASE